MRIPLDEYLPSAFANSFPEGRDIRSTQWMGWNGKENGELPQLAAGRGFEVPITADKNMPHEQNRNTPLAVLALRTGSLRLRDLQPLIQQAAALLKEQPSRTFHEVGEKI